jgi:hypothetical protein
MFFLSFCVSFCRSNKFSSFETENLSTFLFHLVSRVQSVHMNGSALELAYYVADPQPKPSRRKF